MIPPPSRGIDVLVELAPFLVLAKEPSRVFPSLAKTLPLTPSGHHFLSGSGGNPVTTLATFWRGALGGARGGANRFASRSKSLNARCTDEPPDLIELFAPPTCTAANRAYASKPPYPTSLPIDYLSAAVAHQ